MQDITEESEHDLQSVFNKISESLKTINQETTENDHSENTSNEKVVSSEPQNTLAATSNLDLEHTVTSTCSTDNIKSPDKVYDSSTSVLNEGTGIEKLMKETALEISNLLSEKEPILTAIKEVTEAETALSYAATEKKNEAEAKSTETQSEKELKLSKDGHVQSSTSEKMNLDAEEQDSSDIENEKTVENCSPEAKNEELCNELKLGSKNNFQTGIETNMQEDESILSKNSLAIDEQDQKKSSSSGNPVLKDVLDNEHMQTDIYSDDNIENNLHKSVHESEKIPKENSIIKLSATEIVNKEEVLEHEKEQSLNNENEKIHSEKSSIINVIETEKENSPKNEIEKVKLGESEIENEVEQESQGSVNEKEEVVQLEKDDTNKMNEREDEEFLSNEIEDMVPKKGDTEKVNEFEEEELLSDEEEIENGNLEKVNDGERKESSIDAIVELELEKDCNEVNEHEKKTSLKDQEEEIQLKNDNTKSTNEHEKKESSRDEKEIELEENSNTLVERDDKEFLGQTEETMQEEKNNLDKVREVKNEESFSDEKEIEHPENSNTFIEREEKEFLGHTEEAVQQEKNNSDEVTEVTNKESFSGEKEVEHVENCRTFIEREEKESLGETEEAMQEKKNNLDKVNEVKNKEPLSVEKEIEHIESSNTFIEGEQKESLGDTGKAVQTEKSNLDEMNEDNNKESLSGEIVAVEPKNDDIEKVNECEKTKPSMDEKEMEEVNAEIVYENETNKCKTNEKELVMVEKNVTEEPMIIDLDDSDEEKIEMDKQTEENNIQEKLKKEPEKIEAMEIDVELKKCEDSNKNSVNNQTKTDIKNDTAKSCPPVTQTKTSDIIIDLDDEDSIDEKSLKDDEESKKSSETIVNEKATNENLPCKVVTKSVGFDEQMNKVENIDVSLSKDKSEEIKENSQNEDIKTQPLTEGKEKNTNLTKEEEETASQKKSESAKGMELEILEKPQEIQEKYIFHNKECVNYECDKSCDIFYLSPIFVLNFYKVTIKQNLSQYVCDDCYEAVVNKYEEWCNLLETHQPLFLTKVPQKTNEFVEILDSSDEDENNGKKNENKSKELSEETIDMIQKELDNVISSVLSRTEIQNQLTWSKSLLEHRINKLKEDSDWINETLSALQKNADKMNNALYQCPKIEMKILAPLDLNSGKPYVLGESTQANQLTIPPIGEIYRPTIVIGGEYYAAKNKVIASWLPSTVVEINDPPSNEKLRNIKFYKVKFFKMKVPTYKSVPAKHLAFGDVPKVQLSIGTRVIALFDASTLYKTKETHGSDIRSAFYPGVIAEALQPYNNYRYLIFFDDGYTQYVHHRDVRLICEVSANVWDDIHPGSRDFIQNYLINYKKNRPMVQVKKGQSMVTELNGKWIYAKVVDVDASLIQMLFEGQKNHTEWIYRGSTRLGPLFKAIQKTNIPQVTRLPRRSEPFVRYMQDDENVKQQNQHQNQQNESTQSTTQVRSQVARKSTARQESQDPPTPTAAVKHLNNSTIFVDDEEPKGTLIYYSSKSENNPPPRPFKHHMCGPHCIVREHFEGHYGVLSKPLLNSWERSIFKIKSKKTSVVYRAPCGRNFRSIEEVHKYLRLTRNELNVENFVFDPDVGCLNEYQVKKCIVNKADITEGREKIPIQCVNYYDHTMPPDCEYSADRIPTEGVKLNTDQSFLVGCDCKDDCTDKTKCSCWRLTLEGARYGNPHTPMENIGYHYKRLLEPVTTGIYECNSRCKCSSKCINRVVQHPLETKLQVFKTSNRGWGLRCINDVPKGAFICIYAGNLLTEQKANECGDGDEYFAELDYIEVAERLKEGYESDAQEDIDSDEYVPEHDSDEEFNPKPVEKPVVPLVNTRNRTATAKRSNSSTTNGTNDDDDEQERQTINFVPNTQLDNYEDINTKYKSMRRLFGKNEYCYIMDAKSIGNVGRYFNHSCSPNLFVQNVFVDTHDLRFPWVAFFALSNIRAGTELTWNYNYEVGVVPGKVLFCQCGAANCRGRLL